MNLNDFGIQRAVKNGQLLYELGKNDMHTFFYMICLISSLCLFPNGLGMLIIYDVKDHAHIPTKR